MEKIKKVDYDLYILGDEKRRPVAFGGISDKGEIRGLYVDPAIRRQGYAFKIITFLEGKAKEKGFNKIFVVTHHENKDTLSLFRRLGYEEKEKDKWIRFERKL